MKRDDFHSKIQNPISASPSKKGSLLKLARCLGSSSRLPLQYVLQPFLLTSKVFKVRRSMGGTSYIYIYEDPLPFSFLYTVSFPCAVAHSNCEITLRFIAKFFFSSTLNVKARTKPFKNLNILFARSTEAQQLC